MKEGLKIKGELELILRGPDGKIKDYRNYALEGIHNLITTAGLNSVRQCIMKTASRPACFDYCAIGTGTTAANATDTTLETEAAREQGTYSEPASAQGKIANEFGAGVGTGAITESGILNASSSGTLLNRQVFSAVNKGAADTLTVNWTFTFASG